MKYSLSQTDAQACQMNLMNFGNTLTQIIKNENSCKPTSECIVEYTEIQLKNKIKNSSRFCWTKDNIIFILLHRRSVSMKCKLYVCIFVYWCAGKQNFLENTYWC